MILVNHVIHRQNNQTIICVQTKRVAKHKMVNLQSHVTDQPWGGIYLEKGDMDVRWTRPPFSHPSAAPQDPLFSIFQFHKTPFLTKNHKIFEFSAKNT